MPAVLTSCNFFPTNILPTTHFTKYSLTKNTSHHLQMDDGDDSSMYPSEYLDSIDLASMPPTILKLKVSRISFHFIPFILIYFNSINFNLF